MFGIGGMELVIILVIALVVLGPAKLPDAASSLGKAIRTFRKATRDLTDQLDIDDDVKQPFRELKAAIRDEPAPYVPPAPFVPPPAPIQGVVSAPVPSMAPAPPLPTDVAASTPTDPAAAPVAPTTKVS